MFVRLIIKVASNQDRGKSLVEFDFELNAVSLLAPPFFIKSSSKLLVIRTGIKAWSSLILGQIRLLILELLALE